MNTFNDIKELVSTLSREGKLIAEMFSKRKSIDYKLSDAMELVDHDENRIGFLVERSVIRKNDGNLELDDLFLEFFEQVLDVNEEINLSYIDENIKSIKENIQYYLSENNENRKYGYLKVIQKTFRKIGITTMRSVVDLRRNIENTFKNEASYKIKRLKLENLDKKRTSIKNLISRTFTLIDSEEITFFNRALDVDLKKNIIDLKYQLSECSHNLIEIEKQIIDYLNQIKTHGEFLEHLRKLKYLRDHFVIEAETDIRQVLANKNQLIFEPRTAEPLKLSIDELRDSEMAFEAIKRVAQKYKGRKHPTIELANPIANDLLESEVEKEVMINYEEVKNHFLATSDNLFNFIVSYDFLKEVSFSERVTVFCQIVSLYEQELEIKDEFETANGIEYALVLSK